MWLSCFLFISTGVEQTDGLLQYVICVDETKYFSLDLKVMISTYKNLKYNYDNVFGSVKR